MKRLTWMLVGLAVLAGSAVFGCKATEDGLGLLLTTTDATTDASGAADGSESAEVALSDGAALADGAGPTDGAGPDVPVGVDPGPSNDTPSPTDLGPPDAVPPNDVPAIEDLGTADTKTGCTADTDCPGQACNLFTGACVACVKDAHCKDGGTCVDSVCLAKIVCTSDKDCTPLGKVCDDAAGACVECLASTDCTAGSICTPAKTCKEAPLPCASSKDCAAKNQVCDKQVGVCVDCLDDADCTAAQFCTPLHECKPKVCQPGAIVCDGLAAAICAVNGAGLGPAIPCADQTDCTLDGCEPGKGCTHVPSNAGCDDGNACTTGDLCGPAGCVGTPKACDDGKACTEDTCVLATGECKAENTAGPCDDLNPCTVFDICFSGTCQGNGAKSCNDENPCTTDACVPATGCINTPNDGGCSDGNPCTLGDACAQGKCQAGTTPNACDDNSPCTTDSCSPTSGCVHKPSGAPNCCNSNNDCLDGNSCTQDSCADGGACKSNPVTGQPCNDGTSCTTGDTCQAGQCKGTPKNCDDENPCTADSCTGNGQCVHTSQAGACPGGTCVNGGCCQPKCEGKTCGSDGCGGACGECVAGQFCSATFSCKACSCDGKQCGEDGCGKLCGSCAAGTTCSAGGTCVAFNQPCTGPCTGSDVNALLCALDVCDATLIGEKSLGSPHTFSNIAGAAVAVEHLGAATNALGPKKGTSLAVISTGSAVGPEHSVDLPGGQQAADPHVPTSNQSIHDEVELTVTLTAPAGATGFAFRSVFLSVEWEEYIGQTYTDRFYAVLKAPVTTSGQAKIINLGPCLGSANEVVVPNAPPLCYIGVNSGFEEPCSGPVTDISGTGFQCGAGGGGPGGQGNGGSSTGWLITRWPIAPGETFTLTFHIHDAADAIYDSAAVLDGFEWLTGAFLAGTAKLN